jgi:hypothetical protein
MVGIGWLLVEAKNTPREVCAGPCARGWLAAMNVRRARELERRRADPKTSSLGQDLRRAWSQAGHLGTFSSRTISAALR